MDGLDRHGILKVKDVKTMLEILKMIKEVDKVHILDWMDQQ